MPSETLSFQAIFKIMGMGVPLVGGFIGTLSSVVYLTIGVGGGGTLLNIRNDEINTVCTCVLTAR